MPAAVAKTLDRVRKICMDLPEATEKLSHGSPTWFVKKTFVMFLNDHHGDGILGIWAAAPPGAQEALVASKPDVYFRPPYVGHRGWVGMRLDTKKVDWDEVEGVIEDAYCTVAPAKLVALVR